MARNDQVTRILRVISILERAPGGLPIREIHSRLEGDGIKCSQRSVYRDLEAIQRAYFPITKEGSGDESKWRLDSVASVSPSIQFSYRELMGLFIARHTLEVMRGSPIYDAITGLFDKMEKILGSRVQQGLEELHQYLGFKVKPSWQSGVPQEVMDTVHQACSEGHVLEIEYKAVSGESKGEIKIRRVGPHAIYFADSGVYLIAKDLATEQFKTYSLNRIRSAIVLEDAYETHGVLPTEYLASGIGVLGSGEVANVEIQIVEPMASYVSERRWHESQTVTRTETGIELRMRVKVNDELVRWVLGLGAEATVLAPQELCDRVRVCVGEIEKKYRGVA